MDGRPRGPSAHQFAQPLLKLSFCRGGRGVRALTYVSILHAMSQGGAGRIRNHPVQASRPPKWPSEAFPSVRFRTDRPCAPCDESHARLLSLCKFLTVQCNQQPPLMPGSGLQKNDRIRWRLGRFSCSCSPRRSSPFGNGATPSGLHCREEGHARAFSPHSHRPDDSLRSDLSTAHHAAFDGFNQL